MKKMDNIILTEQQKKIIQAPEKYVCVRASAGNSKTLCLIERIKWLVSVGIKPDEIVAITFTRNGAQEILQRLLPIQIGFCGTIHAYANYLLISNGIDTKDSISEEEFDKLFEQIKENPQCCENLKISHLLLDEAQDSNQNQFDFIFDLLKPDNWTIFGDEKQSIFGFNGANPKALTNISKELYVTNYQMTENFRNSKEIHSFASYIISKAGREYIDNSKLMRNYNGKKITIPYDLDLLSEIIKENDDFKDWFVLTRTNKQLSAIYQFLQIKKIPCTTFRQGDLSLEDLNKKMEENTVKVLTLHSSKGLQNKNVAIIGATIAKDHDGFKPSQYEIDETRLAYVGVTRAEDLLIWVKGREKKKKLSSWE